MSKHSQRIEKAKSENNKEKLHLQEETGYKAIFYGKTYYLGNMRNRWGRRFSEKFTCKCGKEHVRVGFSTKAIFKCNCGRFFKFEIQRRAKEEYSDIGRAVEILVSEEWSFFVVEDK